MYKVILGFRVVVRATSCAHFVQMMMMIDDDDDDNAIAYW